MSTIAFLRVDHGVDGPVPRSPLSAETAAAAVGAAPAAEAAACRETVGWADSSQLGKLELQASAGELARLRTASGFEAPAPGLAARGADGWWCPLTPSRALLLCDPAALRELHARLDDAALSASAPALDVSAQFAALTLAGPLARETFARFCALDLRPAAAPVAALRPGSVARTPGIVLREADERYLVLFGAAYASYAWEVVADAGTRLGGRPVAVDALPPIAAHTEVGSHA
jgi:heterotetrameric sarcosine oxidase gamma subunit